MFLRFLSDKQLKEDREKVRQEYTKSDDRHAGNIQRKMWSYDDEMLRRMNKRHQKENPDSKPRHKEHGWYLEEK